MAIIVFIYAYEGMENNLKPSTWMGGYLVPSNPDLESNEELILVSHLGAALWFLHFARRILEVLFVAKFHRRGASLIEFLMVVAAYSLYAVVVAHTIRKDAFVVHPSLEKQSSKIELRATRFIGLGVFLLGEVGNFYSHLQLSWQRPPRGVTRWTRPENRSLNTAGGLFTYVTSAHYAYEMISWVGYALVCRGAGGPLLVLGWSVVVLSYGAHRRHHAYRAYFDGSSSIRPVYPKHKYALIPYVF